MATIDCTQDKHKLSDEQRVDLAIELIRANNLLELATERSLKDSRLLTLLNATQDRIDAIARLLGYDPGDLEFLAGSSEPEMRVTA